jgi:hypothetical protein
VADWAFIAQDRNGNAFADLAPYLQDRNISLRLNRAGEVKGRINLGSPSASTDWLTSGVHELRIQRDNDPIDELFRLVDVDVKLGRETAELDLTWEGVQTYLSELTVYGTLPLTINTAQSAHAWQLIDDAQTNKTGANYGFTRGLVPSTDPTKSFTYRDPVDVLGSIEALSERNDGFDFAFNAARQFDCYYPRRGSSLDTVLAWQSNVLEMGYKIAAGPGAIGTDFTIRDSNGTEVTSSDTASRDTYGRRDQFIVLSDVDESTTVLQQYADAAKTVMKEPLLVPVLSIDATQDELAWGAYGLGDTVTVRAKYGDGSFVDYEREQRIVGINLALNANNVETVTLEMNDPLPMVINQQLIEVVAQTTRSGGGGATGGLIQQRNLSRRIAAIERFLS